MARFSPPMPPSSGRPQVGRLSAVGRRMPTPRGEAFSLLVEKWSKSGCSRRWSPRQLVKSALLLAKTEVEHQRAGPLFQQHLRYPQHGPTQARSPSLSGSAKHMKPAASSCHTQEPARQRQPQTSRPEEDLSCSIASASWFRNVSLSAGDMSRPQPPSRRISTTLWDDVARLSPL